MLSVSPPTHTGGFGLGDFEELKRAAALALVASPHDVVLGGGWDDVEKVQASTPSTSASPIASSSASLPDDSPPSSPSPEGVTSPLSGSGLLIKSKHQGWERSFDLDHEWPRPQIQEPDEVLIRNVTAGLNPVDFKRCVQSMNFCGPFASLLPHEIDPLLFPTASCTTLASPTRLGFWGEMWQASSKRWART